MIKNGIYYMDCRRIINSILPNRQFKLKLVSRIDWHNIVFIALDKLTNEKLCIKIYKKTHDSKKRYYNELNTIFLLSEKNTAFVIKKPLFYSLLKSQKYTAIIINTWLDNDSYMKRVNSSLSSFIDDDLIKLHTMFQSLWNYGTELYNKSNCNFYSINTKHPSLIEYKLGYSTNKAFENLYKKFPTYKNEIINLHNYYNNFNTECTEKFLINGDPSANELLLLNDSIYWIDWEYSLIGYPMTDVAYMFYSLSHNYYNNKELFNKFQKAYFKVFNIGSNNIEMFSFYFIEKILLIESIPTFNNKKELSIWGIKYSNSLIKNYQ